MLVVYFCIQDGCDFVCRWQKKKVVDYVSHDLWIKKLITIIIFPGIRVVYFRLGHCMVVKPFGDILLLCSFIIFSSYPLRRSPALERTQMRRKRIEMTYSPCSYMHRPTAVIPPAANKVAMATKHFTTVIIISAFHIKPTLQNDYCSFMKLYFIRFPLFNSSSIAVLIAGMCR